MNNFNNINYPAPEQVYKVLVRCFTFNHSKYIEKSLNGFAMQQTNFPFVCLVMDDASTDGEQKVIKDWMERECDMSKSETIDIPTSSVFIVPHKTNASCTFAFYLLKQNLYGTGDKKMNHVYPWREKTKYEAICEGDDYWTDPLKLQKQIDFLENNPEYGMCYTKARHFFQNEMRFRSKDRGGPNETFTEFLGKNTVPTLTVVYKNELHRNYIKEIQPDSQGWAMGDYPAWLWFAQNSKIKFLPEVTGVYRILTNSAAHSPVFKKNVAFINSTFDIKRFFLSKYPQDRITLEDLEQQRIQRLFSLAFNHKEDEAIKEYYSLLNNKTFSIYIKYWIRRHLWKFNHKK